MPLLFRKKERIVHVSELNEQMRAVLRALIDSGIPDLGKLYGLSYYLPPPGENAFIAFSDLDGEYRSVEDAYRAFTEKIKEVKDQVISHFQSLFPSSKFLPHFRVTYFSFVHEVHGMISGINLDPLGSQRGDPFHLKENGEVLRKHLQGKKTLIASTPLLGEVLNPMGPFQELGYREVKVFNGVGRREEEIVKAYRKAYETFHSTYSKEGNYRGDISESHMRSMFSTIREQAKGVLTEIFPEDVDVIVVPVLYVKPEMRGNSSRIEEGWRSIKYFSDLWDSGKMLEMEVWPIVHSYSYLNELISQLKQRYQGRELIAIIDSVTFRPLSQCKEECHEYPVELLDLKEVEPKDSPSRVKVFSI
jgi:hypothetical protein